MEDSAIQYSWFLPQNKKANQPKLLVYHLLLSLPSFPHPTPSRSSEGTKLGFCAVYQLLTPAIYFTHCSVYMSIPLSPFAPFFLPLLFCSQETVYLPRKVKGSFFIFFGNRYIFVPLMFYFSTHCDVTSS